MFTLKFNVNINPFDTFFDDSLVQRIVFIYCPTIYKVT